MIVELAAGAAIVAVTSDDEPLVLMIAEVAAGAAIVAATNDEEPLVVTTGDLSNPQY